MKKYKKVERIKTSRVMSKDNEIKTPRVMSKDEIREQIKRNIHNAYLKNIEKAEKDRIKKDKGVN